MQFDKDYRELDPAAGFQYKVEPAEPVAGFMASLPYRECYWGGSTPEEAIGQMLRGVARLARDGSLDPDAPERMGCPPIQHVLQLLTRQLVWHTERRREKIEFYHKDPGPTEETKSLEGALPKPFVDSMNTQFNRDNEIISALATAIAALARVKEL